MATFKLRFEGLCHFVENKDQNALCRMCVVLPDASGYKMIPDHISTLLLQDGKTLVNDEDWASWIYPLRRQRVSFQFFRGGNPLPPGEVDFEFGAAGQRGVIMMEEIAGIFADQNLDVVAAFPPSGVQAQVILGHGEFKVDEAYGETLWEIPGTLTGTIYGKRKKVANRLYLEVEDIERVRVYIQPFEPSSFLLAPPTGVNDVVIQDIYPDDKGLITMFVSNDCNFKQAVEVLSTAASTVEATDFDFRFHYGLLNSATIASIERLGVPVPFPIRLTPASPPVETSEKMLSSFLSNFGGEGASKAGRNIEWSRLVEQFVKILIDLLNSTSGCNCLRGGGTVRLFDLEYFVPVTDSSGQTAISPNSSAVKRPKPSKP